ncbi:HotDog domain-containing protein [Cercophora scortea]|uniref:HotDog domain-containing protein n=1 Tax=Cercophora scortea TaxID=314031 RepID=A0AAE0MDH8_9PEZI|nr:HotDog domain-containing protein [Cercophora scortea]
MSAASAIPHDPAVAAAAELAHFQAIPWCAAHLSKPNVVAHQSISRELKPRFGDALVSQSLNNKNAMAAFVTFYTRPADPSQLVEELGAFLTLGQMVNGWPGICHGGIIMTILDEVMGQLPAINKQRGLMPNNTIMTAYLNTKFIGPVRTPSTIMVTARAVKVEGRKHFYEAVVTGEKGEELAKADALFIFLKPKL